MKLCGDECLSGISLHALFVLNISVQTPKICTAGQVIMHIFRFFISSDDQTIEIYNADVGSRPD